MGHNSMGHKYMRHNCMGRDPELVVRIWRHTAYIVMALNSYGLCSYGLCSYGLYSYGL